jgi:hypothetical protein
MTKDRFTGTVESCSGEPQAASIANEASPKTRENPPLASDCSIVSPKAFKRTSGQGSRMFKLTVVLPPKAAPEVTAGGVTGVMGNGQSGNM